MELTTGVSGVSVGHAEAVEKGVTLGDVHLTDVSDSPAEAGEKLLEDFSFVFEGHNIRIILQEGTDEPWWVLKDVCGALGLSNPTIVADRLDEDERAKFDLGRQGQTNIVNESGLYNVIIRSDKPEAKRFRKWVTSDVLPSIRRRGFYGAPAAIGAEFVSGLTAALKEQSATVSDLRSKIEVELPRLQVEIARLSNENARLLRNSASGVSASASVSAAVSDPRPVNRLLRMVDMADLLAIPGVGRNELLEILRDKGILFKKDGCNVPHQAYLDRNYFVVRCGVAAGDDGRMRHYQQTFITPVGQSWLIAWFKAIGMLPTVGAQRREMVGRAEFPHVETSVGAQRDGLEGIGEIPQCSRKPSIVVVEESLVAAPVPEAAPKSAPKPEAANSGGLRSEPQYVDHRKVYRRSRSRYVEAMGLCLNLADWSRRVGINRWTLTSRLRAGWPTEEALGFKDRTY